MLQTLDEQISKLYFHITKHITERDDIDKYQLAQRVDHVSSLTKVFVGLNLCATGMIFKDLLSVSAGIYALFDGMHKKEKMQNLNEVLRDLEARDIYYEKDVSTQFSGLRLTSWGSPLLLGYFAYKLGTLIPDDDLQKTYATMQSFNFGLWSISQYCRLSASYIRDQKIGLPKFKLGVKDLFPDS